MDKETAIFNDLVDKLKEIKTINEYQPGKHYETNSGDYVTTWDNTPVFSLDHDVVRLEDPADDYEDQEVFSASHEVTKTIVIRFAVQPQENAMTELRKRMNDIHRCIGANQSFFTNKYKDVAFLPGPKERATETADKVYTGGIVEIRIRYGVEPWLINEDEY